MANDRFVSTIPFHITKKFAYMTFFAFVALDVLFVLTYLVSTMPEVRSLTVNQRLAFLDLDVEANLPTNYAILKLYFSSIMSFLMIFWYTDSAPFFWKLAAVALFLMGLDESAQMHEVWGAGLAPKLFGTKYFSGNQFTIFPYLILLGSFYAFSLTLFPRASKTVFTAFVLSGVFLILSQAAEWSFKPAMDIMMNTFELLGTLLSRFSESTLMFAWEEGLEMVGFTLLCGGVVLGISYVQANEHFT